MIEMQNKNRTPSPKLFFSKHASDYTSSESHAHGADLSLLIELLRPGKEELGLDVATGTGFTAMSLARRLKQVIAIDITKEMLSEAQKLSKFNGINNIRFEIARADKLPYEDESFDIIASRRAAHHFRSVSRFLNESLRVLKRDGRLGIVDMSPVEGTEIFCNKIERLRDSTHVTALTPSSWKSKVEDAGLSIVHLETLSERVSFEKWLYPVKMSGREEFAIRREWKKVGTRVKRALAMEETGGEVSSWLKTRIVVVAKKEN